MMRVNWSELTNGRVVDVGFLVRPKHTAVVRTPKRVIYVRNVKKDSAPVGLQFPRMRGLETV